jgi:hypothetical protein
MHIALLPAGTPDAASSRIRVYQLQRALRELGITATRGDSPKADLLLIQKRVTPNILKMAYDAKQRGAAVLYDVDDLGDGLGDWAPAALFAEVMTLADAVTTDTAGHREQLMAGYAVQRVEIIPDSIDYYPRAPMRPNQFELAEGEPLRVLWFGNLSNIGLFERYAAVLGAIPGVQVVIATGTYGAYGLKGAAKTYAEQYPNVKFVPWSRTTFPDVLRSCQLTCLMHDGTDLDRAKSNNKMITSIAWGVPAAVSRTPEYERTARDAGIEQALFSDPDELREVVERLRPGEARRAYLDAAQEDIWERYAPKAVARLFLGLATEVSSHSDVNNTTIQGVKTVMPPSTTMRRWLKKNLPYPVKAAIAPYVPSVRRSLLLDPARPVQRDYRRIWIDPAGHEYRLKAYERQREGGEKPLVENPTFDEVRAALRVHRPSTVLEVGCGWGRLIDALKDEFSVEGCDVSPDMLKLCPPGVRTFEHDIAVEDYSYLRANTYRWDVLFTRGVMMYFMDVPLQMAYAMNNMMMLAKDKIIIWEWPEVCAWMQQFSSSPKFEYHPLEHRSE